MEQTPKHWSGELVCAKISNTEENRDKQFALSLIRMIKEDNKTKLLYIHIIKS